MAAGRVRVRRKKIRGRGRIRSRIMMVSGMRTSYRSGKVSVIFAFIILSRHNSHHI